VPEKISVNPFSALGMLATTRSIQVSAPETKGSCTNPTRGSSKTHIPWCLYGDITLIAFMRFAGACKFCLFTHDDARRIAGGGTGASTSWRIGCVLARIAFSEVRLLGEKAFS